MRINLDQIEEKIKVFFENNLLFLADTNVHENISKELCNIIINASKEIENERLIAPNTFDIFLSPFLYKKIDNTKEFTTSLSKKLQELIHDSDISTLSPITISIFQLDEFSDNEFDIQYTFSGHDITNTSSYLINQPSKVNKTTNPQIQSYIIYGDQIININISVFNIGRGDGNDLILNDRFISRAHAQIRYID